MISALNGDSIRVLFPGHCPEQLGPSHFGDFLFFWRNSRLSRELNAGGCLVCVCVRVDVGIAGQYREEAVQPNAAERPVRSVGNRFGLIMPVRSIKTSLVQ